MRQFTLDLPDHLYEKLKAVSESTGQTIPDIIQTALIKRASQIAEEKRTASSPLNYGELK